MKPLVEDEAQSTRHSWTQCSASDPQSLSHEPDAVSWEMPQFHLPMWSPSRPQPWPAETTLPSRGIVWQQTLCGREPGCKVPQEWREGSGDS